MADVSVINKEDLLEGFFKDFYYELLKCKELALRMRHINQETIVSKNESSQAEFQEASASLTTSAKDNESQPEIANSNQSPMVVHDLLNQGISVHAVKALEEIQTRLKNVLTSQSVKMAQLFQTDLSVFQEMQYAMVALADEIFLNLDWLGRFAWQNTLLEGQLFHSQSAGETVFVSIESLLSRYDGTKIGLARIYFFILTLGFRGKFKNFEDTEILNTYEKRLYTFIYGVNPSLSKYGPVPLVPQCYDYTRNMQNTSFLPDLRFWGQLIFGCVVLYLFVSYIIWYDLARDLYQSLDNLFEHFSFFLSKNV